MLEGFIRKLKKGTHEKGLSMKSILAFFIFGAIVMVFVLFGLTTHMGGGLSNVASVNGRIISVGELQREQEKIKNQYASLFGGAQDLGFQMDFFNQQAVESLIRNELIHQHAEKSKVYVADSEVARRIIEIPAFQKEGRFQREYYANYLMATHQSAFEFESMMKKQIQAIRLRALFEAALNPTQLEMSNVNKLKAVQMNYEFVKLNEADFSAKNKVSEAEVKTVLADQSQETDLKNYFNSHSKEFAGDFATNRIQVAQKYLQRKKFDQLSQQLETAVQAKDLNQTTAILQKNGYKWEETGAVDLSQDAIPKLNSSQVASVLGQLTKDNSFYDKIVRDGQDRYILRLKDVKSVQVASAPENQQQIDFMKRRRGDGAFNEWLQDKRKVAKISVHPQVFSNKN